MYSSIGGKIKGLAVFLAVTGSLGCIVYGILILDQAGQYLGAQSLAVTGWAVMIGGTIGSWLSSLALYGFGELIEMTQKIHQLLVRSQSSAAEDTGWSGGRQSVQYRAGGTWKCPSCGYANSLADMYCVNCNPQ
jgi:hypothetical protein